MCGITKTQFVKQDATRKGFMNGLINKLPFVMHLPGHNFTGPGTKLSKRLNEDGMPKAWSKPINRVDEAAYHHDVCYAKNKDTGVRNRVCDRNMLEKLDGIYNPTLRERLDRSIVSKIIECWNGFKKAPKWSDQLAEELHKPVSRKFQRRRVQVNGIDEIWAADLIDMQAFSKFNRGVKYLMAVIDIFSK